MQKVFLKKLTILIEAELREKVAKVA